MNLQFSVQTIFTMTFLVITIALMTDATNTHAPVCFVIDSPYHLFENFSIFPPKDEKKTRALEKRTRLFFPFNFIRIIQTIKL